MPKTVWKYVTVRLFGVSGGVENIHVLFDIAFAELCYCSACQNLLQVIKKMVNQQPVVSFLYV